MSDRLPRDREKALEAIATGSYTGRRASLAHPLCNCREERPVWKRLDYEADPEAWRVEWDAHHAAVQTWIKRRCPVH